MKLFLTSGNVEEKHEARFRELLGDSKVSKALFITTAAVPYGLDPKPDWLVGSQEALKPFVDTIVETTLLDGDLIPENLHEYDFVFVSGGNTFYLAYQLNETGMDMKLKEYIENDGVYIGSSAGSIVLMDAIDHFAPADDPKEAPKVYPGLGLIKQAIIPHADNKSYKDIMANVAQQYQDEKYDVISLNDDQVFVVDGDKKEVI